MRGKLLLSIAISLCSLTATAQDSTATAEKKKHGCSCSFSSIATIGFLEGEEGSSVLLQAIPGIRMNKWFAGIGIGLDYYHLRGIPLFLDIRRDFLDRKNSPYVYVDGGIHFPWARDQDKPNYGRSEFENGWYYDVGAGYRIGNRRRGFLFSLGYSAKSIKEIRLTPVCLNQLCQEEATEWFRYKLNRLSIKIGVQL